MRRYGQLSADEQARAVDFQRAQVFIDPDILAGIPQLQDAIDQFARRRARDALYIDPGDRIVTLPPPPPPPA
jgi:IMP dehydrogenase/GMP reductase